MRDEYIISKNISSFGNENNYESSSARARQMIIVQHRLFQCVLFFFCFSKIYKRRLLVVTHIWRSALRPKAAKHLKQRVRGES